MKKLFALLACASIAASFAGAQALSIFTEAAPPLSYAGSDGNPAGAAVEIVQELQRRVGNKDLISIVPWTRGLNFLNSRPNVFLFVMGRTEERNPKYQWIGPLYEKSFCLYSLADSPIKVGSLEDAKKVMGVGVYKDDARDQVLSSAGFTNLIRALDANALARMFFGKRFDLMASSPEELGPLLEEAGHSLAEVKLQYTFFSSQGFIGVSKSTSPELVKIWNAALSTMKKDGSFRKIFEKYGLMANYPGEAAVEF